MRVMMETQTGPQLVRVDTRSLVRLYPAEAAEEQGAGQPTPPDGKTPNP
jgi:hypothetical protein